MKLKTESQVINMVMLEASKRSIRLWRNNSGAFEDKTGRLVRFGLGNTSAKENKVMKSSDLIGVAPDGRFVAIECKRPDWKWVLCERVEAQRNFIDLVKRLGGIGFFTDGDKEALNTLWEINEV